MINKFFKKGFTLAEVLITLGIIGVVAAMTIPVLSQRINNAALASQYKKTYSTLTQAFGLLKADYEGDISPIFDGTGDDAADAAVLNEFATRFKVIKNCGNAAGCWYTTSLKWLDGTTEVSNYEANIPGHYGKAILVDGSMLRLDASAGCTNSIAGATGPFAGNICGGFEIDINGAKGPNQRGRDYFSFVITTSGIYPLGSYNDGRTCDPATHTWLTNNGCGVKILTDGGMEY